MFFRKTPNKRVHIKSAKKDIIRGTDELTKALTSLSKDDPVSAQEVFHRHLSLLIEINTLIVKSMAEINTPLYLIPSLFLRDSFKLLNHRDVESLHFVTGPEVARVKILDQIVPFNLEQQNVVYAKGEVAAIRNVLIQLNEDKFRLWGYFHIHPGVGANATLPSGTDLNLDRLLDNGSYEAIGAIFSRDGFIRFFSCREFKIQIYGEGVEKIDEKLYHLVKVS